MYYICILLSRKHIFKEKVECCEELFQTDDGLVQLLPVKDRLKAIS